jgi:hypothetical protein
VMAKLLHPIMTKAALTLVEPAQWRGGMFVFFPKAVGAGTAVGAVCANNRETVLADIAGKAFHKCRRRRILPYFERAARPSQMGGISHRGADFGSLAVRCLAERCKTSGLSYALVFVDISAAFYNLRRRYLDPGEMTLTPEEHNLCHNVLARLGCSAHTAAAVAASCRATWFSLQHDNEFTAYTKGVLPGDSEADLLLTFVIKEELDEIHRRLCAAGLVDPLEVPPHERHTPSAIWSLRLKCLTWMTRSSSWRPLPPSSAPELAKRAESFRRSSAAMAYHQLCPW